MSRYSYDVNPLPFRSVPHLYAVLQISTFEPSALSAAWLSESIVMSAVEIHMAFIVFTAAFIFRNFSLRDAAVVWSYGSTYSQKLWKYTLIHCSIKFEAICEDLHRIVHELRDAISPNLRVAKLFVKPYRSIRTFVWSILALSLYYYSLL